MSQDIVENNRALSWQYRLSTTEYGQRKRGREPYQNQDHLTMTVGILTEYLHEGSEREEEIPFTKTIQGVTKQISK